MQLNENPVAIYRTTHTHTCAWMSMPRINVEDLAMVIPIGVTESNNKANELQVNRSLLYPATLSIVTNIYVYILPEGIC